MPAKKTIRKKDDQHQALRFLRADARRSVDSLLCAAMVVFETSGVNAPIKEIASKAGVGVGTFYRHFPQRSDLIVAVLELQIDACADAAKDLAAKHRPDEALSQWMQLYVDLIAKKRGFAGALHSGNSAYRELGPYFFKRMEPALNGLLAAAVSAKFIHSSVSADDLLRAVATLCHGPNGEEPSYARDMVRLLLGGMTDEANERHKTRLARK